MRRIDAMGITRARTNEERLRRNLYGEVGATFSKGKYMTIGGRYCGTITTSFSKDNLVAEVFETT